jgi:ribonuclease-3
MRDLVTVFRTQSDVEATIVRSLLEASGVLAMVSSPVTHAVFPLTVSELGEVRISVRRDDADEARRIIEGHRIELPSGRVLPPADEFADLERAIEYRFRDRGLLERAMTHTSRANEDVSGGAVDNESLEFLGDAILGFVVADLLFRELPSSTEGQKSKIKAALVSATTLARLADRLLLGEHLLLGRGEETTGGRRKQALIADAYEALIAAIYLDGGVEQARAFIVREFAPLIDDARAHGLVRFDHKSALQEHLQARNQPLPEYRLTASMGPDHRKEFRVAVCLRGEAVAEGTGASKKDAEQEAARLALEKLGADSDRTV